MNKKGKDNNMDKFSLLLNPEIFLFENLTKFNKTTNVQGQIATDLNIVSVISFFTDEAYFDNRGGDSKGVKKPKEFNMDNTQPFLNLYPTQPHRDYIWNPSGNGSINQSFIFSISFISVQSEIDYLILIGKQNFDLFFEYFNNTHSNDNKIQNAPNPSPLSLFLPNLTNLHLPHKSTLRYYNSAHNNSTHCLNQRTCGPIGGVNIISTISQPNFLSKQPWIFIPVPINTRNMINNLNFGLHEEQSTLIMIMAVAKTLVQYYNATITHHDQTPSLPKQPKLVFGLLSGDSYDFIGTRALLNDLWKSHSFRHTNSSTILFDSYGEMIPSDITTNAEYYPCTHPIAGVSRPPFAPYLNTTQASCLEPRFQTQASFFQGLSLSDLDTIIQIQSPLRSKLYAHIEHNGLSKEQIDQSRKVIEDYQNIAKKVKVLEQEDIISIEPVDEDITPGLPPTSVGIFGYNMTYIDPDQYAKFNITKIPKTVFVGDFSNIQNTNKYKFSPFESFDTFGTDSGHNILCGHATAFTRLLLQLVKDGVHIDKEGTKTNDYYKNVDINNVNVDCDLINNLIKCFKINRSCDLFTNMASIFQFDSKNQNIQTETQKVSGGNNFGVHTSKFVTSDTSDDIPDGSTERGDNNNNNNNDGLTIRQKEIAKNLKKLPFSNPSSVYFPRLSADISGFPRFLYNWFYLSGYYTAWNSNKYNSTMHWEAKKEGKYVEGLESLWLKEEEEQQQITKYNIAEGSLETERIIPNGHNINILNDIILQDKFHNQVVIPDNQDKKNKQISILSSLFQNFKTSVIYQELFPTPKPHSSSDPFSTSSYFSEPNSSNTTASQAMETISLSQYDELISFYQSNRNLKHSSTTHQSTNSPMIISNNNNDNHNINHSLQDDQSESQKQHEHDSKLRILLAQSRFSYFHDAVDPYVNIDYQNDKFVIDESFFDPDLPFKPNIWTESNWDSSIGVLVYTKPHLITGLIIFGFGLVVFLTFFIISIKIRRILRSYYGYGTTAQLNKKIKDMSIQNEGLAYRGVLPHHKID
jgi:hypothetical protein